MRASLPRGALMAALLLAGCGHSPQTRILTLDAVAPPAAAVRADYRGPPLAVPAVHVPAAIDRPEYVSQPTAGEVRIDDFAQWAAPLGLLARDALVRDLTARLPEGRVLPPGGGAAGGGAQVVDVTILALDIRAEGSTLHAAYRLLPTGPIRQAVLTSAGATAPPAASQALSALIAQLADRIVSDLPAR